MSMSQKNSISKRVGKNNYFNREKSSERINSMNQLVSILIPVYNNEKYLGQAIESAFNQTWPFKEIIVVNDGSSDNSLSIAKSYEQFGIKVVNQFNKGAAAARNLGLSQASGKFIQYLDADDILSANKIEIQVNALNGTKNKLAVCSTIHFPDDQAMIDFSLPVCENNTVNSTDDPVDFIIRMWGGYDFKVSMVQPNAWLTPKELIDNVGYWDEDLSLDDDGEFFARILLHSSGIVKTDGFNYYRKYPSFSQNLSSLKDQKAIDSAVKAMVLKTGYLFQKTQTDLAKKAIFRQLIELSLKCYPNFKESYIIIEEELKKYPRYNYRPILGGKAINLLSKVLGWKAARKLQYFKSILND